MGTQLLGFVAACWGDGACPQSTLPEANDHLLETDNRKRKPYLPYIFQRLCWFQGDVGFVEIFESFQERAIALRSP